MKLGERELRVVAQRHSRLTRRLFGKEGVFATVEQLTDAMELDATGAGLYELLTGTLGGKVYELLCVFIPGETSGQPFMPRWEWDGYASQTAADEDQYDEDASREPTIPEIKEALSAAMKVNDLDWLGKIKDLIDPKLLRNQVNLMLARATDQMADRMATDQPEAPDSGEGSQNSPQLNGASDLTSSGMTPPTPEPVAVSD